jgi:hypothetical protein
VGIHICVVDEDGKDVPGWDWLRHAGDREFPSVLCSAPVETIGGPEFSAIRPVSVDAARDAVRRSSLENKARFYELLDLLDSNITYRVHFS